MTTETKNFKVIKGIGNKSDWMFLLDENNDVIHGFKSGTMEKVREYLDKKYALVVFGGFGKWGTERCRFVMVVTYERVVKRERVYTESDRMLANAQSARTQLKAWDWKGLK